MTTGSERENAETSAGASGFEVRFYRPTDRAAVRQICADTGFLGKPVDPLFEDRELFADYLTRYYTDWEPESTVVCLKNGILQGYVMGSRFPRRKARFEAWHNGVLAAKGLWRYFTRPYNAATRQYIKWVVTEGRRQTPFTPPGLPHFHINLLPAARNVPNTKMMLNTMFAYLAKNGEKGVYGQMITFDHRRGERMFAKMGFRVIDQKEVTKYRDHYDGKIFLYTVVRDLTQNHEIYGLDFSRSLRPEKEPEE
jgi:hypothetical protein